MMPLDSRKACHNAETPRQREPRYVAVPSPPQALAASERRLQPTYFARFYRLRLEVLWRSTMQALHRVMTVPMK